MASYKKIAHSSGTVSLSFFEQQFSFFLPPSIDSIIPPIIMGHINGAINPNKVANPKLYLAINGIENIITQLSQLKIGKYSLI